MLVGFAKLSFFLGGGARWNIQKQHKHTHGTLYVLLFVCPIWHPKNMFMKNKIPPRAWSPILSANLATSERRAMLDDGHIMNLAQPPQATLVASFQ